MNHFIEFVASTNKSLGLPEDYENKYGLTLQYEENDLVEIENDIYGRPQKAARIVFDPWFQMKSLAKNDGISLAIVSAFRSVEKQKEIIQKKLDDGDRIEEILTVCAAPGYSEHHSGRALDITTHGCKPLTEEFDTTETFAWLQENAHSFLFSLSYPKGNKHGIAYEPWHWAFNES